MNGLQNISIAQLLHESAKKNEPACLSAEQVKEVDQLIGRACDVMTDFDRQGWISVDEKMPTTGEAILAWDGLTIRRVPLCLFKASSDITHWMPLPQPPRSEQ